MGLDAHVDPKQGRGLSFFAASQQARFYTLNRYQLLQILKWFRIGSYGQSVGLQTNEIVHFKINNDSLDG